MAEFKSQPTYLAGECVMSHSESIVNQEVSGLNAGQGETKTEGLAQQRTQNAKTQERFMATGIGSRGGPNKMSNKLKRNPRSYLVF
jgi:hypothetical protein